MIALPLDNKDPLIDQVVHGDCLAVLRTLPDNYVHALVCDPPAGINFMQKEFDSDRGGRDHWIAWLSEIMREALRVVRPGGSALVWALPRTSHWTATALENAGWECRDVIHHIYSADTELHNFLASLSQEQREAFERLIDSQASSTLYHLFGSGFPKSTNVSKAIDKMYGAEREIIGGPRYPGRQPNRSGNTGASFRDDAYIWPGDSAMLITKPATPEAAMWSGFYSALKPSAEHWILVRKPLSERTIAENVLKWHCGGLNVDACRIGTAEDMNPRDFDDTRRTAPKFSGVYATGKPQQLRASPGTIPNGRYPSHTLLSHTLFCRQVGVKRVRSQSGGHIQQNCKGMFHDKKTPASVSGYHDEDGMEEVQDWQCSENCPVRLLDEQTANMRAAKPAGGHIRYRTGDYQASSYHLSSIDSLGYADNQGGASRYFAQLTPDAPFIYTSKASKRDRSANGTVENTHPTAKSTNLMRYLCRLACVPGGTVLDPFCGSGSTLVACIHENMHFIGIEENASYCEIAEARIRHTMKEVQHGTIR